MDYNNVVDLDAGLTGTLTVGQLTGTISQLGNVTLGPLYTQTYDSPNFKLANLYDQNSSIYHSSKQPPSFIIGGDFTPSLVVNSMADGNTTFNPVTGSKGTLRGAVESANLNYQNGTTGTQVIHLGPGTYKLSLPPTGNDGVSSGDLNIASNLVIEGVGAGQTIIDGASLDRIFNVGSSYSLTLEGVTVQGGSANYGAGIYNAGTLAVNNSILTGNSTIAGGFVNPSSLVGGGIDNAGTLTVSDSTLWDNNSDYGAGIYNTGSLAVVNSTLYNNIAFSGGGIYNNRTLTVNNGTIYGNTSSSAGGGGIYANGPSLLQNTLVAGNHNYGGLSGNDIYGMLSSTSAYNLIGDGTGVSGVSNGSNGNQIGTFNSPIDPKFAPLANYGGPTPTMELLPGSPAIDGGSNADAVDASGKPLTTDQRGNARIISGNVDLGAVEYQNDLGLSGAVIPGTAPGTVQYVYTVSNNGPDPAAGVTLTVSLPQGVAFRSRTLPASWNETDPGAGNNGTVTFLGNLNSEQSANFIITAQLQNTAVGSVLSNTATVGPVAWDNNLQNNSVTLTIATAQEGQTFNTVKLFHFTDPNPSPMANDFTASVGWGDGSSNNSGDGSGTVFVVADPNGGFDILGSHTYAEEGSYLLTLEVTGVDGTSISSSSQQLVAVADAPLATVAFTPPSNATINQPITNAVLFHFTDADSQGEMSDYTAKVTWGDGSSNSSGDGTGNVSVVADHAGGFDVIGSHTYIQILNLGTFQVQVNDAGGSSTSAGDSNFQVLNPDQPLTAGSLSVPSVSTEGQSISKQVLFHFSDADSNAQASDYVAAVSWGDGTTNSSSDGSGSVAVVANANGGFDVVGSHTYGEGRFYFGVKITDMGDPHSTNPDSGGHITGATSSAPLTILDPAVVVKAGPTFMASQNTLSAVQTVATFTDPGGPESNLAPTTYVATIQWGDGTSSFATLTAQVTKNSQGQVVSSKSVPGIVLGSDGQTFSVNLAHQYATGRIYTITTTLLHDGISSTPVTTQAVVTDQVSATGGFSITGTAGVNTGSQTVATFTDPGGAGPLSDYSASINWGDGTSSQSDITSGVISFNATTGVFTVSGAHTYATVGSYPIVVLIENLNAFPVTVNSTASINPATPTVTVSDAGGTYNGKAFPATATTVGVDGKTPVSGSFTFAYYVGTGTSGASLGSAPPTNAGTYTVVATFTSADSNYTNGSAQTTFTIAQATTAFSNLTVQRITVGTDNTTVLGQLTSNTIIPVGQSVLIALNGKMQPATVAADGGFSTSFATGALGVGTYSITYSYGGDANFAAASGTGSLMVAYGRQLLFNNSKPVHSGACLPIKLALTDASGTDISSPSIAVTAVGLVDANGNSVSLQSKGNANPNNLFRYDPSLGGYIFNLDTKGLAAGVYTLYYESGNDPTLHALSFVVN